MVYETVTELDQLIDRLKSYNAEADLQAIRKAYEFSAKAHEGQIRRSGEPYLQHPLAVAGVLTLLGPMSLPWSPDCSTIRWKIRWPLLKNSNGSSARRSSILSDGVTKIGKITFRTMKKNKRRISARWCCRWRTIFVSSSSNSPTGCTTCGRWNTLSEHKRQEIAQETLEIYAPLANRLGIGWIKNELEDLCLKHLKPDVYETLRVRVAKRDEDRQQYIHEVIEVVKQSMTENALQGEVSGRPKHLFGIYQKMEKQSISFEEVYDLPRSAS